MSLWFQYHSVSHLRGRSCDVSHVRWRWVRLNFINSVIFGMHSKTRLRIRSRYSDLGHSQSSRNAVIFSLYQSCGRNKLTNIGATGNNRYFHRQLFLCLSIPGPQFLSWVSMWLLRLILAGSVWSTNRPTEGEFVVNRWYWPVAGHIGGAISYFPQVRVLECYHELERDTKKTARNGYCLRGFVSFVDRGENETDSLVCHWSLLAAQTVWNGPCTLRLRNEMRRCSDTNVAQIANVDIASRTLPAACSTYQPADDVFANGWATATAGWWRQPPTTDRNWQEDDEADQDYQVFCSATAVR